MAGQRFAVERPRQKGVGVSDCSRVMLRPYCCSTRELLRPELHLFLAAIGAEEHELARLRLETAGAIEHRAQRHARPSAVAAQALKRPPVARAFEAGDEFRAADLAQLVERQRQRPIHKPRHLQPEGRRLDDRMAVVLRREEPIGRA